MSDVELYWQKISNACGDGRTWHQLQPAEQQFILQSIQMLLAVIRPTKTPDAGQQ
jgi:hypothetical protein